LPAVYCKYVSAIKYGNISATSETGDPQRCVQIQFLFTTDIVVKTPFGYVGFATLRSGEVTANIIEYNDSNDVVSHQHHGCDE